MNELDAVRLANLLGRRVAATVRAARERDDLDAVLAAMARTPTTGECPHRVEAKRRYAASNFATMIRESRESLTALRAEFGCGQSVLDRGGSVDDYLACRR